MLPFGAPRWRFAAILAVIVCIVGPSGGASAQVPTAEAEITLTGQPIWHEPGDAIGLRLRVVNAGPAAIDGFRVRVAVSDRVATRSELEQTFEGVLGFETSAFTKDYLDLELTPGESVQVVVNDPVTTLSSLGTSPEGGVFPIGVSLYDAQGALLDSASSAVLYYPTPPEIPLALSLVLPLAELPARGPSGVFGPSGGGIQALEDAVSEDGWMTSLVSAIRDLATPPPRPDPAPTASRRKGRRPPRPSPPEPTLHLGIAPVPRTVEELADLADGYQREAPGGNESIGRDAPTSRGAAQVLAALREAAEHPGIQILLTPYSLPDLPSLTDRIGLRATARQLSLGREVLSQHLDYGPRDPWLFAPAGRLDSETLDQLRLTGTARRTFFASDALEPALPEPAGCPEVFASFTCPVAVTTEEGVTEGLLADAGLRERLAALARPGDDRADVQRFFAETAMIHAELPGTAGRVAHATIPSVWRPTRGTANLFLRGLAAAPWLRTVTPAEALEDGLDAVPRELTDALRPVPQEPAEPYYETLRSSEETIEHFSSIGAPAARVERLRRSILVAQSRLWWLDEDAVEAGAAFASEAESEAQAELDKITIGAADQVTLTSRRGELQFVVFNDASYPVTVNVRTLSPKVEVTEVESQVFEPGTRPITVEAVVRASGAFPLRVWIETPDGYLIDEKDPPILIRSTQFNRIALGLTLGALAFLVFFAVRALRRRRTRATDPDTVSA